MNNKKEFKKKCNSMWKEATKKKWLIPLYPLAIFGWYLHYQTNPQSPIGLLLKKKKSPETNTRVLSGIPCTPCLWANFEEKKLEDKQ